MEQQQQIEVINQVREELDQRVKALQALPPSRERSLAITNVQQAIMWLGADLMGLSVPLALECSINPESNAIPTK